MRIFFSAGEPSGDLHGANLIAALERRMPGVECVGYGGPRMAAAGCRLHADLTALAVMWLARVLANLPKFLQLVRLADREFRNNPPDAVVLIDYPGFNWWIARRAKAHGIPVFYYAPPQLWAWAAWRVRKMRRLVDHVLCGLPFEARWFSERGCRATLVGHPYFDEVHSQRLDETFLTAERARGGRRVTLLPGSRTQEIEHNLRPMLAAARLVQAIVPDARFAVAAFRPDHADYARRVAAESGLAVEVHVGRTPELIAGAECCLAVSGSVSLELLHRARPTVIVYQISRLAYGVQSLLRKARYITLVNLLAHDGPDAPPPERAIFPEFLTCRNRSVDMAYPLVEWLTEPAAHRRRVAELEALRDRVAQAGAANAAAQTIAAALDAAPRRIPRPHWQPGQRVTSSGLSV